MRDSPINGTIKENNTFTLKTLRYAESNYNILFYKANLEVK